MILRPKHCYSFLRVDENRYKREREEGIKYPYIGEILSDSWGDDKEPKNRLLWDEDVNSADVWEYEDIYPELLVFVNNEIQSGYTIHIGETFEDPYNPKIKPNDFRIQEHISKLDDAQWSHFVEEDKKLIMSTAYGQFFAYAPNRPLVTEDNLGALRGIPFLGDKVWNIGDTHLYCIIESGNELQVVTLSHKHIKELENNYEYIRMSSCIPVFKKREN